MNDESAINNQETCEEMEGDAIGMDEYEDDGVYDNNLDDDDEFRHRGRGRGFRYNIPVVL